MQTMTFGELLTQYRESRKMTKTALAQSVGKSLTYIIELENGRKGAPTIELVKKLSEALSLSQNNQQILIDLAMGERFSGDTLEYITGKEKIQQIPIISWVAANLVMSGVDIVTVSKLLGHSRLETTMIYSHLSQGHIEESIKKLNF